jgi:hypothetical protein
MKNNGSIHCVCIAEGKVELAISRVKMRARVDLERSYWQAWRHLSLQTGKVAQHFQCSLNGKDEHIIVLHLMAAAHWVRKSL